MTAILRNSEGEALRFDVVGEEGYNEPNDVTEFPVEDGTLFADHIQEKSLTISFNGVVSASPFANARRPNARQERFAIGETRSRVLEAVEFLRNSKSDVFEFYSVRLGVYENMAMQSLSYVVDGVERLDFQIELKKIRTGRAVLVEIPPEAQPPPSVPPKVCGEQPPAAVEEVSDEERDISDADDSDGGDSSNELTSFIVDGYEGAKEKTDGATTIDLAEKPAE